jgi:hypothetical protein
MAEDFGRSPSGGPPLMSMQVHAPRLLSDPSMAG